MGSIRRLAFSLFRMQTSQSPSLQAGPSQPVASRATFVLFAGMLIAAAWVLARPYIGLRHDGLLYLGQILLHWHPEIFSQDIFFQFGSQDRFSVAASVLANLYRHVEFATAQIGLVMCSQLAVIVAALVFLRRAGATPVECVLGLVALGIMSHNYGGWAIFSFSERFVTGRTFAEPFALLALLLIQRNRVALAALAMAVSMVFHPLVAIPTIVVAWGVLVVRDRRWAWALMAVPVAFALALAQIDPFSRLIAFFDEAWFKAVRRANAHTYVVGWNIEDLLAVVFDCAVVWAAARVFPSVGTLLRVTAIATVALVCISAVGTDGLHNVLLTQLQLWRVHWITRFFSLFLLPILLLRAWRKGDPVSHILVFSVAAAVVTLNVRFNSAAGLTLFAAAALWLNIKRPPISPGLVKAARAAAAVALVAVSVLVVLETATQLGWVRGHALGTPYFILLGVTAPVLSLPAALLLLQAWRHGRIASAAALLVVSAGLVYGIGHWDQRTPWIRYLEENLQTEHPWEKLIAPTEQVLWWDEAPRVWGLLHRPSYYSILQGAGLLFNRGTAVEHSWRAKVTGPIQIQRDVCELMSSIGAGGVNADCWPTIEAVEEVCRSDARLGYVVIDRKLERGAIADWSPMPNFTTFYLHDCKQIR